MNRPKEAFQRTRSWRRRRERPFKRTSSRIEGHFWRVFLPMRCFKCASYKLLKDFSRLSNTQLKMRHLLSMHCTVVIYIAPVHYEGKRQWSSVYAMRFCRSRRCLRCSSDMTPVDLNWLHDIQHYITNVFYSRLKERVLAFERRRSFLNFHSKHLSGLGWKALESLSTESMATKCVNWLCQNGLKWLCQ